jgi:hypothetical protein
MDCQSYSHSVESSLWKESMDLSCDRWNE